MTRQILLLAILTTTIISSCTTAYKTGQTPDDVYYSPARPQDEYVRVEEKDRDYSYSDEYYDDRYLRMKVRNRSRWDDLNDWYFYDRYSYSYNYTYGSWYNPYNSWNYYHNPYCHSNVIYVNPKGGKPVHTAIIRPRSFNVNSYTNTNYNNANSSTGVKMNRPSNNRPVFNNSNNNTRKESGVSNVIRKILSPGSINNENSSNSNSSSPSRTYTPSSNSSSNSSSSGSSNSSGSSGGGVSRPTRGGN